MSYYQYFRLVVNRNYYQTDDRVMFSNLFLFDISNWSYPPTSLKSNLDTLSGKVYGDGKYTVSASSSSNNAWKLFDSDTSSYWQTDENNTKPKGKL